MGALNHIIIFWQRSGWWMKYTMKTEVYLSKQIENKRDSQEGILNADDDW